MTVPFGWVRWSDPGTCARLIPSLNVRLTLSTLPGLCQADNKATLGGMADRDHLLLYLAVDLAILTVRDGLLQALVIERAHGPYQGQLALPGGFLRDGEDLRQAAGRELAEETGLDGGAFHLEQLATYGAPGRDPRGRVVSLAWLAIAP